MRKIVVNMERGIVDGVYSNEPSEVDFRWIENEDIGDESCSQEYWRNIWLIEHGCYTNITGECEKVNKRCCQTKYVVWKNDSYPAFVKTLGKKMFQLIKIAFLDGFLAAWGSLTRFVRGIDRVENEEERDKLESVYQLLSPLLDIWEQQYDTLYEELWANHCEQ